MGHVCLLSESFDDIDGRTLLAQTATPVIGPEAMAAPPRAPILDEDPMDELVTESNVSAEVKLPARRSTSFFLLQVHKTRSSESQQEWTWSLSKAVDELELPSFPVMLRRFLYDQLYPDSEISSNLLETTAYPAFNGNVAIFYAAVATFRAPSDSHGVNGMRREYIRATPSWRGGAARYDCILINSNAKLEGMCGLDVARVLTFISFSYNAQEYQCALIHWFAHIGTGPDETTGLWMVEPEFDVDKDPHLDIIHVDCIYRAAHLTPIYKGNRYISRSITMHDTLDTFSRFYVNKYVDYHAFETAF